MLYLRNEITKRSCVLVLELGRKLLTCEMIFIYLFIIFVSISVRSYKSIEVVRLCGSLFFLRCCFMFYRLSKFVKHAVIFCFVLRLSVIDGKPMSSCGETCQIYCLKAVLFINIYIHFGSSSFFYR